MGDELLQAATRSRVRCALVGDQPLVAQCAELAARHGLDVVLVATDDPIVRQLATGQGIAVVGGGADLARGLDAHPADVLLSVANLRVIGAEVLARVTTAVNFHDGPLPGYAGLDVTTWAILGGERHHEITWHLMTADVDGGDVVTTERFPIGGDETAFSLNARCYEAALASFPRVAEQLATGTLATRPQPDAVHRMFRRHQRPALLFDPTVPAAESARAVRALDLGHRIRNAIGAVRLVLGGDVVVLGSAHVAGDPSGAPAGTLVAIDDGAPRIATGDGDLVISTAAGAEGTPVDLPSVLARHGIEVGGHIASPDPDLVAAITAGEPALAVDEAFWLDRLAGTEPVWPSLLGEAGVRVVRRIEVPANVDRAGLLATVALWLARVTSSDVVTFAVTTAEHRAELVRLAPLARAPIARFEIAPDATFGEVVEIGREELRQLGRRRPLLCDAVGRDPRTRGRPLTTPVIVELDGDDGPLPADGSSGALRIVLGAGHVVVEAVAPDGDPQAVDRLAGQLGVLLEAGLASPRSPALELPMLGRAEQALLEAINRTELDLDRGATIDALFHDRVARSPHAPALSSGSTTLSYAQLEDAVASMRTRLATAGVGRGDRVGIAVPRGVDMVVAVLATLDLGAAYLPLDPTYPTERLGFMIDDAGIAVLVSSGAIAAELRRPDVTVVDPTTPAGHGDAPPDVLHDDDDLAYLIYTSGSTGLPKGVMLEHRQVANFFAAMDQVIDHDRPGTWLAVTSLSFDISVLELLWTLTRGFHVVLKSDRGVASGPPATRAHGTRPVAFSLFYFAAGEAAASDGYRLLLDSARFADRHGFEAVWTPERHFHAFGGAYPNPSVTGAALAAITTNVGIRAGSVVLPLHSPIRVAEEWAVVDNLSHGRVAISFAAGWQPNDFVLNPTSYATAKEELARSIDTVQRLWSGEAIEMPGHDGEPVAVRTLPRPVQAELPVWLTSAGSPSTFERAGTLGVNVLTHLLGQSVEQLTENIERYRTAWRGAGHDGEGRVTLMMHTYLDRDAGTAREVAREPMKGYLGTAVGLLRDVASAFPTFAGRGTGTDDLFASLSADEMDQLLEVAADRYLSTSGLFGTPADAAEIVETVSAAGVDEVACLIDFGVGTDAVLGSLDLLLEAKQQVEARRREPVGAPRGSGAASSDVDDSVAGLAARHGVTHLQCTPSLAAMLVADPADRAALATIGHLMLGGEALPTALAAELRALLPGRFTNMYGPTETTIWSLTHEIDTAPGPSIPIGTPIANTSIFVLDRRGCPLPVGSLGELHIGGHGVARGYHDRPELTAQRFVERPGTGRVYATGDVVRIDASGSVEFVGRSDSQVKIRGHRIEMGEIEAALDAHPDVVRSVVVARDHGGDTRLVAYAILHRAGGITSDALRKHLAERLPEAMVPSVVVALDAFPLTPNGKIDRNALPAVDVLVPTADRTATVPPVDDTERLVAETWSGALERVVGREDNFFDIGGHSLLAVKVFRQLAEATGAPLALTDVFRFPTVRTFAAHLAALQGGNGAHRAPAAAPASAAPSGTDRGAMRRRALARRGGGGEGDH